MIQFSWSLPTASPKLVAHQLKAEIQLFQHIISGMIYKIMIPVEMTWYN